MVGMSRIDYAAFVRGALDAIIVADARGQIVEINPAAEEMLGWTHTELEGQPLTVVMPERYREAHTRGLTRLLARHGDADRPDRASRGAAPGRQRGPCRAGAGPTT